jgi:hypothetical protein
MKIYNGVLLSTMTAVALTGAAWAAGENGKPMASAEPMAMEQAAQETPSATKPAMQGGVERSAFTSAVVDREPLDELKSLSNDTTQVSYFTELTGMEGKTVIHRWEHDGESWDVAFDVAGPRWRVHSSKMLDPSWTGDWKVTVLDMDGNVISEEQLRYETAVAVQAEPEAAPPAAPAPLE